MDETKAEHLAAVESSPDDVELNAPAQEANTSTLDVSFTNDLSDAGL
jgi:hypothetical protein